MTNNFLPACPLNKITPDSKFASALMFYMGTFILFAVSAGIFVFALSLLPKRIKACPVSDLAKAQKIALVYKDTKIVIPGNTDDFNSLISNLTDERKQADTEIASTTLYIYAPHSRYTVQVSMAGWNFLNEEKNSRRLLNNLQVMKTIDSVIDKQARSVVK